MAELAGSSILILGATGGLGRHLARQLADAGANLVLSGRSQQALDELDVSAISIAGDLRDPELPRTLVATAIMAYGRLDGVINASGVVAFGPIAETSDEVLDELWQVNALAPMRIVRAAAPAFAEAKTEGSTPFIVHFSGLVSEAPTSGLGAYSAVKSALAVYQQVAARELRRQGIRVLDARPGHTETELSRHPIAGEAPKLPTGYEPEGVARRVIAAIVADEKDLPSSAFTEVPAAESEMIPVEPADVNTGAHPAVRMAAQMPLEASAPVSSSSEPSSATEGAAAEAEPAGDDQPTLEQPAAEQPPAEPASPASVDSPASVESADSAESAASVPSPPAEEQHGQAEQTEAAAEDDESQVVHAEAVEYVAPEPLVEPSQGEQEQGEQHDGEQHDEGHQPEHAGHR
ncbi:hypothetical protein GCM10009792_20760 [Microcella alkalica]|uniref:Cyclic-di-GMP-binding biofilm dispersal mediator protein n=1 Tax=Microcella alkalica TaxID=355930 RepID=A0A839E6L2_9MICO|nr:SDR family oxidoreductase [Microcella alkalica]MBA8847430.1 cyclic-di-GMP-binding biofilm dispersal mediator protein [Microcella alkalica]